VFRPTTSCCDASDSAASARRRPAEAKVDRSFSLNGKPSGVSSTMRRRMKSAKSNIPIGSPSPAGIDRYSVTFRWYSSTAR
jgi:hypothetical protein